MEIAQLLLYFFSLSSLLVWDVDNSQLVGKAFKFSNTVVAIEEKKQWSFSFLCLSLSCYWGKKNQKKKLSSSFPVFKADTLLHLLKGENVRNEALSIKSVSMQMVKFQTWWEVQGWLLFSIGTMQGSLAKSCSSFRRWSLSEGSNRQWSWKFPEENFKCL